MEFDKTKFDAAAATLIDAGFEEQDILILVPGAMYLDHFGAIGREYWTGPTACQRDEFLVSAALLADSMKLIEDNPVREPWRTSYDVASLMLTKMSAQSIRAIDDLVEAKCYADAFTLCRGLHSRMCLLILCAMQPDLFDWWLKDPQAAIFREREVQRELENNGVRVMQHFYDYASELSHSHPAALDSTGLLTYGLFPELPAVGNRVYVTAKFLIAAMAWTTHCIIEQDAGPSPSVTVKARASLFETLFGSILHMARMEHLTTFIAEDRHWRKTGKDKYDAGGGIDFQAIKTQLSKFHRRGQRKELSKNYSRPPQRPPVAED